MSGGRKPPLILVNTRNLVAGLSDRIYTDNIMRRRRKAIDKRRVIIGLIAIIMILLGILLYTIVIPFLMQINWTINVRPVDKDTEDFSASTTYLKSEEAFLVSSSTTDESVMLPIEGVLFEYVEVVDGCGPHYEGECLRVRSGPGVDYPVISRLRNGMVLKVGGKVESNGMTWYKIIFDEWLRYPERVGGDWYVVADYVKILLDEGSKTIWENDYSTTTQKSIIVDRSEQKVYAYEGEELFMVATTSTGLQLTPTPRGTFKIFKKTPSRYMQGPLPNLVDQQYYDLPGVPWNLYFTDGGAVIHGAYWHNSFGSRYSHGCVNLPPAIARILYTWADLGTKVIVKD